MRNRDRKQFAVLGLGRFGLSLAAALSDMGCDVLAVDKRDDLTQEAAQFVTQAITADATDDSVLESLGLRNFDAAIVSIGQNVRDSILVAVQCKELGAPFVVAKANDARHASVLRKIGVDKVVFPERDMGQRMARSLLRPNYIDTLDLADDYQLIEIAAPTAWCGKTLMETDVRRNFSVNVIAIHREHGFIVSPAADETIRPGDELLVLGRVKDIDAIVRGNR